MPDYIVKVTCTHGKTIVEKFFDFITMRQGNEIITREIELPFDDAPNDDEQIRDQIPYLLVMMLETYSRFTAPAKVQVTGITKDGVPISIQ